MPCDATTTCGIEIVDSSIAIGDGEEPRTETDRIIGRKKKRNLHSENSSKQINHYKMASRPIDAATNLSASCTSSSSSSSSSTSSFCYDRPRQNDSTNSSSSLILILERPETHDETRKYEKMVEKHKTASSNEENEDEFEDSDKNLGLARKIAGSGGFTSKVTSSSIENLAKKKAVTPTTRCRRRRSTASPRTTNRNSSIIIDDNTKSILRNTSFESKTLAHQQHQATGFVATSTLTKNSDCSALLISKNASRSAAKLKLQSSCVDSSLSRNNVNNNEERNFDKLRRENIDSQGTLKSQQSTISVAAIRGTNVVPMESRYKNNDNCSRKEKHLTSVPRYGNAYASAPSLNNNIHHDNHKTQNARTNREFSSHYTSTRSSTVLPLAVVSTGRLSSSPSQQHIGASIVSKKNKKSSENPKMSETQLRSTVKSSPSYVLSSGHDLSRGLTTVGFANSLKSSSSFTAPKAIRKNRSSRVIKSLHASLGQLPLTGSSCATSAATTTVGDAASLENFKDFSTPNENNEETTFVPITLYSTNSSPGETKNCSIQTKNSLERICHANGGGSTSSSSFSKTPLRIVALPEVENSPNNVANAFRNNLIASGYNNININNNNNNSNNANARCNHLLGTCACSATTTTSQTSSTLTRTSNLVNGIATSSSWTNNSVEQETDYVVDPVQGNAYHKGQFLGKGGFARVYLMTDVANGNQYACKIIPKNRMQKIHIQKIAREIMIHKELNHVNVVQMHHYFEDNINVYMLLEPCPRKSLMHVLKYRGKVTEPEARYYMRQMVTGVAYIHSQKVVHRDLKPGNMFLSDGMIVKIGDFGLATRPDGQRRRVTICGTPNYIAPEVLYKQAYSYEADVWALGCILYALLAGQPPFDTSTLKETYARICNNRYKKLDDSVVSRSGQDLIRWLLQPIPELRPSLERVKEHAYLTMEYVPSKLSHTCCYRIPITNTLMAEQSSTMGQQQIGISGNSAISRGVSSNDNIDRKCEQPAPNLSTKNQNQTVNVNASQANLDHSKTVALTKKPKVSNWLFKKLPKLPRFRQRLTKFLCPEHKKPDSIMMHRAIESCLAEIQCTRAQHNPILVDRITPLFVTKWIDYSNKYGLGFQLSDRSVGVLFNDSTKMSYTHDRRRVEYATTEDEVTRYRNENDVPSSMEEKLELLRHFTHYMDNFLTNGGEVREQRTTKFSRTNSSSVPRMRRWLRTDKAIVMELTVPLLQVNFFVDHSKIVVSEGTRGRGYLVTYIDASRQASSYWLNDLRDIGCTTDLHERLIYVSKVIAELENDAIFETATNLLQNRNKTLKT